MRVTNQMMAASTLANLNMLRSRTADLTEQISSGNRITKASQDPTAGGEVMRSQSRLTQLSQWESNLSDAKDWVRNTESTLGSLTDLLNKAKELAMQGTNGTLSDETRKDLATAVDELLAQLMATLNEQEPMGALFGGFVTDQAPFAYTETLDPVTGEPVSLTVTYAGDAGVIERDLGPGVKLEANIPGGRLVDPTDPNNMIQAVWELAQGLKYPGKIGWAQAAVDKLDGARKNVIGLRAEMGAREQRIEHLEGRMEQTYLMLNEALEKAQGVDMEKAILELTAADTTYRAALQLGARVMPTSLADFLR